jgi:multisubunit Na+/H+ antiporter MnhF subunit
MSFIAILIFVTVKYFYGNTAVLLDLLGFFGAMAFAQTCKDPHL